MLVLLYLLVSTDSLNVHVSFHQVNCNAYLVRPVRVIVRVSLRIKVEINFRVQVQHRVRLRINAEVNFRVKLNLKSLS